MWQKLLDLMMHEFIKLGYKPAAAHYMADDLLNALARSSHRQREKLTLDQDIDNIIAVLNKAKEELNK